MLPTIHATADDIRTGRVTPLDLLMTCLERIDRYEPRVHAWVLVDRDGARRQAEELTGELRRGRWRGPLHGIPLAIKDIFDVFDWPTAAGSALWARSIARRDATVVQRLRDAGAVFIGKTVTTQYASFDPPVTRNPWNTEHTPGGSSSGSAAALACGMCLGALGSQTGGSIARPAAYCGVTGCKPTFGRVSTGGVVPLAASMDHVGPMACCVRDLAILLQIIAGADARDPACSAQPVPDFQALLSPFDKLLANMPRPIESPLARLWPAPRVGRVHGLFDVFAEPATRAMMEAVTDVLRQEGAQITDVVLPASFSRVTASHRTIMAVEAAAFHQARLEKHPEDYEPRISELLREGLTTLAPDYARCKDHQKQLAREMLTCFKAASVLLVPATPGPAPEAGSTGDPVFNSPWSFTGYPTVSLPTGRFADGLPLGIQLVGPPWREAELLAAAAWCEEALGVEKREPPG
jgi:Asp-tRNA(Asn)/Glu-tRNA(Gln) amidotransferase A subunit family amidase